MYIRSRKASLVFKFALALLGTAVLVDQTGLLAGSLSTIFFLMFTNLSNIAVVLCFWIVGFYALAHPERGQRPWCPKIKHALMLAITVTFLVAHFMLNGGMVFMNGIFNFDMLVLHYIVPIGAILDWLLFDEKGTITKFEPFLWLIFPLAYFAYIMIMVLGLGVNVGTGMSAAGRWPYPFLNIDLLGVPTVAGIVVAMVVFFLLLGYGYYFIDKKLAQSSKKRKAN